MLHLRIMMRSGGCVARSQNTDTDAGVGGRQELSTPVDYERYGLPDFGVCTQGDLKAFIYSQASRVLETTFFA
jgi:hypothetical protein